MARREINLNTLRVKDLMTPKVKTIDASDDLNAAAGILWANKIHSAVVVKEGKLYKIITSLDIVNILVESFSGGNDIINTPIEKFMQNQKVLSISPDASIKEAIELFSAKKISHLPVEENGKLVGILSNNDIIRFIGKKP